MIKIVLSAIVIILLATPVMASDLSLEKKAYVEGILQGKTLISMCATTYLIKTSVDDGGITIGILIKQSEREYMHSLIYEAFDVCQNVMDRYPSLPSCTIFIGDLLNGPVANTGINRK